MIHQKLLQYYGTSKQNSSNITDQSSSDSESSGSSSTNKTNENIGLAVFKNDILVGELTSIETLCHLLVTNKFTSSIVTIPDPDHPEDTIDIYLYNQSKKHPKVDIINNSPYISLNISLNARILSLNSNSQYTTQERINSIENYANLYLKQNIYNYLYKTSKTFYSDIAGFGKYARNNFITIDECEKYNWLENYKNSFFNVTVSTHVKSGYLLTET